MAEQTYLRNDCSVCGAPIIGSHYHESECECSEEYGPCEDHVRVLASREGASTRTADELLIVWCEDAAAIIGADALAPWGTDLIARAWRDAVTEGDHGCHWFSEERGDALRSELETLENQLESSLASMDEPAYTFRDDGYQIVNIIGGPLVDA